MEPTDLTIQILREIREDIRGVREDNRSLGDDSRSLRGDKRLLREDLHGLREDFQQLAEHALKRFEVIETALRDLTQQLVLLARGVRVTLDRQPVVDDRRDDLERRG